MREELSVLMGVFLWGPQFPGFPNGAAKGTKWSSANPVFLAIFEGMVLTLAIFLGPPCFIQTAVKPRE